jgi:hypothetical protein
MTFTPGSPHTGTGARSTTETGRLVPDSRHAHDVSGWTASELERAKRDLEISLALSFPGSPVRVSILAEMTAIDAELAERQ